MRRLRDCHCHFQDSEEEEEDDDSEDDDSSGTEIAARLATSQATSLTVRRTIFRSSVTTRQNLRRLALRLNPAHYPARSGWTCWQVMRILGLQQATVLDNGDLRPRTRRRYLPSFPKFLSGCQTVWLQATGTLLIFGGKEAGVDRHGHAACLRRLLRLPGTRNGQLVASGGGHMIL